MTEQKPKMMKVLVAACVYNHRDDKSPDDDPLMLAIACPRHDEVHLWDSPTSATCLGLQPPLERGLWVWEGWYRIDVNQPVPMGDFEKTVTIDPDVKFRRANNDDLAYFGFALADDDDVNPDGTCAMCGGVHGRLCPNSY